jgi:probable H4MPT-linked C1 transfer pathway protein
MGYLIYTGMIRGNVATLLRSVMLDGISTPVSSEYFAASADVHLVLGHIDPSQYTCDSPDKQEKTRAASLRRLARVVCADLEEIGVGGALQIAGQYWEEQKNRVCSQVERVAEESAAHEVITAGIGAHLFSGELGGVDLTVELGAFADVLPAFSVRELAKRGRCS